MMNRTDETGQKGVYLTLTWIEKMALRWSESVKFEQMMQK